MNTTSLYFLKNSCFSLMVAASIFIFSCQNSSQNSYSETATIDTTVIIGLMKQRLWAVGDSSAFEIKGVQIYPKKVIDKLYQLNSYLPLWKSRDMYQSYIQVLDSIHYDGLMSDDYNLDLIKADFQVLDSSNAFDYNALIDLDILTTNSFLLLTLHMLEGKSEPVLLDPNWNYNFHHIDKHSIDSVYQVLAGGNIASYFDHIRARGEYYLGTYNTMKDLYRIKHAGGWQVIDFDPEVKIEPGSNHSLVPSVRQRLAVTNGPMDNLGELYDTTLVSMVAKFQQRHGLKVDGIVNAQTLNSMNISIDQKIDMVKINLERLRWLINDLIQTKVLVNIASFSAYLFKERKRVYSSKVMVGKTYHKTPVFEATIQYIEINPTWTVPRSILMNEMLHRIKNDPSYLPNRNMTLLTYDGQVVSRDNVDFNSNFPYMVRQGPGKGNALGRVKFIFPNKFSVYLHDTPSRQLFAKTDRAFSHGCIRLENPLRWAEQLIDKEEWDRAALDKVVSSGKITRVIPDSDVRVMIVYLTHLTDIDGSVYFYPDIYQRDQQLLEVLVAPTDRQVFEYQVKNIQQTETDSLQKDLNDRKQFL